jgi:hypothetical protein
LTQLLGFDATTPEARSRVLEACERVYEQQKKQTSSTKATKQSDKSDKVLDKDRDCLHVSRHDPMAGAAGSGMLIDVGSAPCSLVSCDMKASHSGERWHSCC